MAVRIRGGETSIDFVYFDIAEVKRKHIYGVDGPKPYVNIKDTRWVLHFPYKIYYFMLRYLFKLLAEVDHNFFRHFLNINILQQLIN